MKFTIACVLLLAVATQTQLIGGYTGYPSLLPAATSLQWLPAQGQPSVVQSVFSPVYPRHQVVNYRGIVGSAGAPWYFYNPYTTQTVQESAADVKDAGAAVSSRTRRQIQLRYGSSRRGRSLSEMIEPAETDEIREYESVAVTDPARAKRQIQLRYRPSSRRGRSLNEPQPTLSAYPWYLIVEFEAAQQATSPVRTKRQIQLRYRPSPRRRLGRSLMDESIPWSTAV